MPRWRNTIDAHRHAARRGDFHADLCRGQYAAVTGLGALAEFQLDHFHLIAACVVFEFIGAKCAVRIAATEVTGADLPNNVAAVFLVVSAVAALAGIVRELPFLGADVERPNGVWT